MKRTAAALGLTAGISLLSFSCALQKDFVTTQGDVATTKANLEELKSSASKAQAGISEEVQELKRTASALKAKDEEYRQALGALQQKFSTAKVETDENLQHLSELNRDYQKTLDASIQNLSQNITARIKDLDIRISDLRRQLEEKTAMDNDQNRRLGETTERQNVMLEEVNAENARLKEGLVDIIGKYNLLADKLNSLNKELAIFMERSKNQTASLQDNIQKEISSLREELKAFIATQARYHVILEGETLTMVASKYGVSVESLVRLNNLADPDSIKVGQRILISSP